MTLQYDIVVSLDEGNTKLTGSDFHLRMTEENCLQGEAMGVKVWFAQNKNAQILLKIENTSTMACDSLGWVMKVHDEREDFSIWRVPCFGANVDTSGMPLLGEIKKTHPDSCMSGLFLDSKKPCLFLGTKLPQSKLHMYQVEYIDQNTVTITGTTKIPVGMQKKRMLSTEVSYVIEGLSPLESMQKYAEHIPRLQKEQFPDPLVGWNSWDYYFSSVSSEDICENMRTILSDSKLRDAIKCVIIDDGWESCVGDWYANHKFPDGLEMMATTIREHGFIPGIWMNGAQVQVNSYPGLRCGEMLLKEQNQVPITKGGMYVLDPTHPKTEAFLTEVYSRLYEYGFRIFKVDFVDTILLGETFYDKECGPYDAIRRLYAIIRNAVGEDSHIIGCSYPAECGAGYVDSSRIGVDIHNQWGHVEWVIEYMQNRFWCNERLYRNDVDMLIVRGKDTSLEEETNVYNPFQHKSYGQGNISNRWRRGEVFDIYEAETWANLVICSAGNLMFGDRLSMLNEKGLELVHKNLVPQTKTAIPLDLGEGAFAGVWYTDDGDKHKLLLINHEETEKELRFCFRDYHISEPEKVQNNKNGKYEKGVFKVMLHRHESVVVHW